MGQVKFFVECCKTKKDDNKIYVTLKADVGYRVVIVTMEPDVICQIADISFPKLYSLKAGDRIEVGSLLRKDK